MEAGTSPRNCRHVRLAEKATPRHPEESGVMICESVPMKEEHKGDHYRYWLHRDIAPLRREGLVFVLLNPSTATATIDAPTIPRSMVFAALGYRELTVVNLFAIRATKPKDLIQAGTRTIAPKKPSRHTMGLPSRPYGGGRGGGAAARTQRDQRLFWTSLQSSTHCA